LTTRKRLLASAAWVGSRVTKTDRLAQGPAESRDEAKSRGTSKRIEILEKFRRCVIVAG
jgi:hypothetical protein